MRIALLLLLASLFSATANAQQARKPTNPYSAYLFAYFTGNSKAEEAIRFATSRDGYHYTALNGNRPVIASDSIASTGGVRDPHILRGADGKTFYMVVTDMVSAKGWNSNRAMVLLKSKDLVRWQHSVVNIQQDFPGNDSLLRVWAPQTIYDAAVGKYMIYFSMKHGKDPDKIYYAYANKDFTALESAPKQLFFSPTNGACIDGDIVLHKGKYHLFFKTEGEGAGIKIAVSDKLTEGYVLRDRYVQQTSDPVEGAGVFPLNDGKGYVLMYDVYTKGRYQFTRTTDLEHFKVIDQNVQMNFHPRHGTVMPITKTEADALEHYWRKPADILSKPAAAAIRTNNILIDTSKRSVVLPVHPGTSLAGFDPRFAALPQMTISPTGPQAFAKGPVPYTINKKGAPPERWTVQAKAYANPVLNGLYADPDILYAEQTGLFYIYPTSDGFTGWAGTYFKAFSSPDLVHWKDEGVILNLEKDVAWAKKNAWAPCIIEKKVGNQYRYFYCYTAAQKIGVAVADKPTGPFVDSGKPLIDRFPEGIKGGQQIDPEVFTDPTSGKSYLYWGNGYMAGAELNGDMVSLKEGTTRILTPDASFREGTTVFFRNGTYYFMWSEDDTRSPNYKVRYGTAAGPLEKIQVPAQNLVIAKDTAAGIYGTGHNTVLQLPGKDEWYLVYHRFNYPKGITMGDAAGYNREVCIDKMSFNADGTIVPVRPTHAGIQPVQLQQNDRARLD